MTGSGSTVDRAAAVLAKHRIQTGLDYIASGVDCSCGQVGNPLQHRRHQAEVLAAAGLLSDDGGLRDALQALHRPFGVYDECDCEDKETDAHIEVDDVGYTCSLLYRICEECCTGDGYVTESCNDGHTHGPGLPICATAALLSGVGATGEGQR